MELNRRTTEGKPTLEVRLNGARELAERAARALAAVAPVDRATHGFHAWPAGLHPDAARDLLQLIPPGPVLDPFCGGGTTLVEALLAGRAAYGSDLSPIALLVASLRTAVTDPATRTSIRSAARRITESARFGAHLPPPALLEAVAAWYEPHVLRELEAIRAALARLEQSIEAEPGARSSGTQVHRILLGLFSSILIKVSHQASDSDVSAVPTQRPEGTTAILFHKKARELSRRLEALAAAIPLGASGGEHPQARLRRADARTLSGDLRVAGILTSPPYPGVYDYVPIQSLRHAWLGLDVDEGAEIGSRRAWRRDPSLQVERWRADTDAWMRASGRMVQRGGRVIIVIGDGLVDVPGETAPQPVDAERATLDAGRRLGWRPVAGASLLRPDHARRSARWEHAIVFDLP